MCNKKKFDKYYLHRDISWMYFNERILQEATKKNVPLLEKISFLGIYSNNLDEFFRVRVASLCRVAECNDKDASDEKKDAIEAIKQINKLNSKYSKEYEKAIDDVKEELAQNNIFLIDETQLDDDQKSFVTNFYQQKLNGYVFPIWLDSDSDISAEADDNIFLLTRIKKEEHKNGKIAVIELPVAQAGGRFVRLPDKDGKSYLMYIDDVIRFCLPQVFVGIDFSFAEAYSFKFTKDAEMEIDNDPENSVLRKISKGVKSRKKGDPLRFIYDSNMPKEMLKKITEMLGLSKSDTILAGGKYHNHKDFMSFPSCDRNDLKYPKWEQIQKFDLPDGSSILDKIREHDQYIHLPYHSFDAYIRVLQEASINKDVKGIKTTLYRVAKGSKVVKALINAARNGKKVTVVIELLARFDEASNINWSKKMQEAGVKVVFGVEGLKIHSKITYIDMKDGADIACISTGNFHEGNSKVYTDYMLMTASKNIVNDVENVFDFINKPYSAVNFKELLVSPNEMKQKFIKLINEEIKNKQAGKTAYIQMKVNNLTDPEMVNKLYEASSNGVKIDMLVRGNCAMVTGVKGVSDTIRICGIIDKYLEHSRIFIFANGGDEKVFIGSADWMPRNLDNRIEVVAPINDPEIKKDLKTVIEFGLKDNMQGRIVDGLGDNLPWKPECKEGEEPTLFRSQERLYEHYSEMEKK